MWLRPQGYARIDEPDKAVREADTCTCFHCGRVWHVRPRCDPADLGGYCTVCAKIVCWACTGKGCDPLEEKLRRMEARKSYGAP